MQFHAHMKSPKINEEIQFFESTRQSLINQPKAYGIVLLVPYEYRRSQ